MAMSHLRGTQGVGAGSDSPQLESDKYSIKQAAASLDETNNLVPWVPTSQQGRMRLLAILCEDLEQG
jgi:hypothetical protein